MGLVKKCDLSSLLYSSVSDFAVQMQCSKLTQIICAFCTFGERIAPLVSLHPNAIFWNICCPLVITRDRWLELSMQMLHMAAALNRAVRPASTRQRDTWPDRHLLELASARITAIFRAPVSAPPHMLSWHSTMVCVSVAGGVRLPVRPRRLRAAEAALLCQGGAHGGPEAKRRRLR